MPADEVVDVVDEHDAVMGAATIGDCLERGLLHRAVAVLVVRSDGRFLLQQRSKKDVWHPGLWTLSSTGHVKAGEPYEEAAARELGEELGITSSLVRLWKRHLPPIRWGGLTESEWVTLFVAKSDMLCSVDRTEVEEVTEVSSGRLQRMFNQGSMTPDAVILLKEYLQHSKDEDSDLRTGL